MRRSASEIIRNLEMRIARLEKQSKKFPPKAVDLNKLPDNEGFWNMTLSDLKAINPVLSTRGIQKKNLKMADLIFFLNMAAGAWKNTQKGRKASARPTIEKSLFSVGGERPETGAKILEINDYNEDVRDALEVAFNRGSFVGYHMEDIELVEKR